MAKGKNNAEKSAIVAASGMMSAVWLAILVAVRQRGGTDEHLYRLNTPEGEPIIARIAEVIVGAMARPIVQVAWRTVFPWIIAACRFRQAVDSDITAANFPPQPGDFTIKEVVIVPIDQGTSTAAVLALLERMGLRPATLVELLWWWLTHPTERTCCFVVALGSVWNGRSPCVAGTSDFSGIDLAVRQDGWKSICSFAAVSK